MNAKEFAAAVRAGRPVVGYWVMTDSPVSTERVARTGYDYVAIDMQHGMLGYSGMLAGLTAIDAAGCGVGIVRVESSAVAPIGRALDAGAAGVIVPLVDTAEQAAAAVLATRYPPLGVRSYGPMRSAIRIGPAPSVSNESVVVLAMIETRLGLENLEAIAATPGLDGLYIGPSDLTLALGGSTSTDEAVHDEREAAIARILDACRANGIAAGIHTPSGDVAARRREQGFTFVTVAGDITHLEQLAAAHLKTARGDS